MFSLIFLPFCSTTKANALSTVEQNEENRSLLTDDCGGPGLRGVQSQVVLIVVVGTAHLVQTSWRQVPEDAHHTDVLLHGRPQEFAA